MARPLRIERAGGWYHVTARGNERREIYRDTRDREHFLELVEEVAARLRLRTYAYVRGELWKDFRERHGDGGREMVLYVARREGGLTLSELAQRAGLKSEAAVAVALRRYGKRLEKDPHERGKLTKVSKLLIVRS